MTVPERIAALASRGVRLAAGPGGSLDVDAPAGMLTSADLEELRQAKPALLALLVASERPGPEPGPWRGPFPAGCQVVRLAPGDDLEPIGVSQAEVRASLASERARMDGPSKGSGRLGGRLGAPRVEVFNGDAGDALAGSADAPDDEGGP